MYSIYSDKDKEISCDDFAMAEATFCRLVKTGCSLRIECDGDGETIVKADKGKIFFTHPNIMKYKHPAPKEITEDEEQ